MSKNLKILITNHRGNAEHDHPAQGKELLGIGPWFVLPGMGLGRERPGFLRSFDFLGESTERLKTVMKSDAEPMRLVLQGPDKSGRMTTKAMYWLIGSSTPERQVANLRDRCWPTTNPPSGIPVLTDNP